jgi:hypothetical protein
VIENPDDDLVGVEEAARIADRAVSTLRYWRGRNRGEGPPSYRRGNRVVYRRGEVEAWTAANRLLVPAAQDPTLVPLGGDRP